MGMEPIYLSEARGGFESLEVDTSSAAFLRHRAWGRGPIFPGLRAILHRAGEYLTAILETPDIKNI